MSLVQIAQAREPDPSRGSLERSCNVHYCMEPCVAVVDVGGGTTRATSCMSLRLCADHARQVRDDLSTVLGRAEAPEGEPCWKRLSAAARDEILGALRNLVDSWMDCAASHGIHEDKVTTAVEEAAVNWQYARKREKAAKARKRGKAGR